MLGRGARLNKGYGCCMHAETPLQGGTLRGGAPAISADVVDRGLVDAGFACNPVADRGRVLHTGCIPAGDCSAAELNTAVTDMGDGLSRRGRDQAVNSFLRGAAKGAAQQPGCWS